MKEKITVIKVGGKIVEEQATLAALLDRFAAIEGHKVLIHGGGRSATRIAAQLGIESRMVDGRRITDKEMLEVVTMVYGGLVNKNIVAGLQARGINALGLTGADCNIIRAHKRPVKSVDYGFVGDVEAADGAMLSKFIGQGITPIVAPLTHDGKGNLLNTNADTMAAETAKALAAHYDVTLIYCFELPGVMRNPEDESSLIATITRESYGTLLADGTVSGGMIPKIDNAFNAIESGVERVIITRADAIDGKVTQIVTHKQLMRVMKIMEAAFRSDELGAPVAIDDEILGDTLQNHLIFVGCAHLLHTGIKFIDIALAHAVVVVAHRDPIVVARATDKVARDTEISLQHSDIELLTEFINNLFERFDRHFDILDCATCNAARRLAHNSFHNHFAIGTTRCRRSGNIL